MLTALSRASEQSSVTHPQSLYSCIAHKPKPAFFVPTSILEKKDASEQPSSPLSKLPIEILLLIVEITGTPYFQVSLGLTCKRIASTIFDNRHVLAKWRGYRDKEGLYRLLTKVPRSPIVLEPIEVSRLPQPYIPSTFRLCRACFRYVPRDLEYWSSRISAKVFDEPSTNWYDIFNFFEEGWRGCGQHRCPDCVLRGYLCFMNELMYKKALQDDEKDARWYEFAEIRDWEVAMAETSWRRVCPALPTRLDRP